MAHRQVGGSSLNPCDSDSVQGYPGCPQNGDGTPGGDVAGIVVGHGPTTPTARLEVGAKVWADRYAIGGGMAEYGIAHATAVPAWVLGRAHSPELLG